MKKIGLFLTLILILISVMASGVFAQSLAPGDIPKYVSPLVIPPSMPQKSVIGKLGAGSIDYYEIAVRQFQQQILPTSQINGTPIPPTTVWSYGPAGEKVGDNLGKHATAGGHYFYPAFTIEADYNRPVRVKWVNELKDAAGNFRPHLLPVDPTLHWANPPGGKKDRDMRPMFMDETPGPYNGPVPMVSHLHGTVGVGDESDGYAEAWYLPAAKNIPAGYATEGTWYDFFKVKSFLKFFQPWNDGSAVFQYPNKQRATTLWYHDHTLGMTRVNVYAGPAGFYLLRGGPDDLNLGYNPPGPTLGHGVKPGVITEIPLAIQDRSFNADGSLFFPDSRAFFDGFTGPYIGSETFSGSQSDISPIHNPEFFGNTMVVNGQTWPVLNVEPRRYRFRLLNGCNSRFLILDFSQIPGVKVWQIGNEGGFLPAPLDITNFPDPYQNRILLGLAERADIIVDFTHVAAGGYILGNVGPDEPFGGGVPGQDFTSADPTTTGQVMQFVVGAQITSEDKTKSPAALVLPALTPVGPTPITRKVSLNEVGSLQVCVDANNAAIPCIPNDPAPPFIGPRAALLGTMDAGNNPVIMEWMDAITENPALGATEVWEIYNFTADAHPIHIHETHFQVIDRQALSTVDGMSIAPAQLVGDPIPPEFWEDGAFKDTVIAYPGQVTRVKMKFGTPGLFVWHCHIIDHEDNEMMRPYFIGNDFYKLPYHLYIKSLPGNRNLF